jgi:DHA1 family multidrug resistance protein-like MFS transporter
MGRSDVEEQAVQEKEAADIIDSKGIHAHGTALDFPEWKKGLILTIVCTCCMCVTAASSVISTSYDSIKSDLGASDEVVILSLSLFVLGVAMSPPLVGPFSEQYGRRVSRLWKNTVPITPPQLTLPFWHSPSI